MSLGTWEPTKGDSIHSLDEAVLRRFVLLAQTLEETISRDMLAEVSLAQFQWVMKLPATEWQLADNLTADEITALVRLFTLVEGQVPGWDAGKDSPVIPLVRYLKQRSAFEPALRKWVKANTDNRYLPNGSAL